ncbi:MAG: UvrB/UvrC motif-containing protein [Candidatus Sumerlaeota bacterium]|nr:UvrB/UvrC motif-containing protein [Candidatus Sumerlaeota bacterium]
MQKNCDTCGKPATHKIIKVVNGQIEEHYFCGEHASGAQGILAQPHLQVSLEELLKSLLSQASAAVSSANAEEDTENADLKCAVCGLPFPLYRKTMILGCDHCYDSFRPQILNDLRKFHGATRHVGMRPPRFTPGAAVLEAESMEARERQTPDLEAEAAAPVLKSAKKAAAPAVQTLEARKKRLDSLRKEMSEAVKTEDFEKAARLRDAIREMEEAPKK